MSLYPTFLDFYYEIIVLQYNLIKSSNAQTNSDFLPQDNEILCVLRSFIRKGAAWDSPIKVGLQLVVENLPQEEWKLIRIRIFKQDFTLLHEFYSSGEVIPLQEAASFLEENLPKEYFSKLNDCYHKLAQNLSVYMVLEEEYFSFGEEEFTNQSKVSRCSIYPATKMAKKEEEKEKPGKRGILFHLFSKSGALDSPKNKPEFHYPFLLDKEILYFPYGMLKFCGMKYRGRKGCDLLIEKTPSYNQLETMWLSTPMYDYPLFDITGFSSVNFEEDHPKKIYASRYDMYFEDIEPLEDGVRAVKIDMDSDHSKVEFIIEFTSLNQMHVTKEYRNNQLYKITRYVYKKHLPKQTSIEFVIDKKTSIVDYIYDENDLLIRKDKSEKGNSIIENIYYDNHDEQGNWCFAWKGDKTLDAAEKIKREIVYY